MLALIIVFNHICLPFIHTCSHVFTRSHSPFIGRSKGLIRRQMRTSWVRSMFLTTKSGIPFLRLPKIHSTIVNASSSSSIFSMERHIISSPDANCFHPASNCPISYHESCTDVWKNISNTSKLNCLIGFASTTQAMTTIKQTVCSNRKQITGNVNDPFGLW